MVCRQPKKSTTNSGEGTSPFGFETHIGAGKEWFEKSRIISEGLAA